MFADVVRLCLSREKWTIHVVSLVLKKMMSVMWEVQTNSCSVCPASHAQILRTCWPRSPRCNLCWNDSLRWWKQKENLWRHCLDTRTHKVHGRLSFVRRNEKYFMATHVRMECNCIKQGNEEDRMPSPRPKKIEHDENIETTSVHIIVHGKINVWNRLTEVLR